jgi:outer membrane lipoprotein SlyB
MRGRNFRMMLVPVALAAALSACASNGVAPGYVTGPSSASASSSSYGGGAPTGETGRVVSVNEVPLRGQGGSGSGSGGTGGMMTGGLIGAAGGSAIGAIAGRSLAGVLVGAVLGGVGGAIVGNIAHRQTGGSTGRGIEVTVQKDDGQTVRVAQRDDGDVQLGDRVAIVQDRNGTAKAVRDTSRAPDPGQYPQSNGSQYGGPPPQDMQSSGNGQRYVPSGGPDYSSSSQYGGGSRDGVPPAEYGQQSRSSQSRYAPRPQDDPRYGNLD